MPIRHNVFLPCLAVAVLMPASAMAQEESRAGEIAEKLKDPMTQYAVAGMLSAISKAFLEMRIEPFVKAMEGIGAAPPDLPPDATVGDLAGTDGGKVREKLIEHVPRAMDAMGDMAGAADEMMPEIEAAAKKLKDAIPAQ